eukprot:scaffold64689_cov14-Tisochrysis_lutea.AAC.1
MAPVRFQRAYVIFKLSWENLKPPVKSSRNTILCAKANDHLPASLLPRQLLAFPQHKPSSAEVDFPAAPVCSCQCMIAMRLYSSKTCAPVLAQVKMPDTKEPVRVRVGMHTDRNVTNENLCLLSQHMKHYMLTNPTGNVVSGLIGSKLPKFSIFGDTMNTASRMESTGGLIKTSTTWLQTTLRACFSKTSRNMTFCMPPAAGIPGRIHVSEATQRLLQNVEHWEPTGGVEVKGK